MPASTKQFFAQVPIDLQLAVGFAGLTSHEAGIVGEMLVAHFGLIKRGVHAYSIADSARSLGLDRNSLRRARNRLVARLVLIDHGNGSYRLNKNWKAWIDPDTSAPLVGPHARDTIASLVVRLCPNVPPKRETKGGDEIVSGGRRNRLTTTSACETKSSHTAVGDLAKVRDAGPGENKDLGSPSRAGACARNSERDLREESSSASRPPEWDHSREKRLRSLVRQAKQHVAFDEYEDDPTFRKLDDLLRVWIAKGDVDWIFKQAFAKAQAKGAKDIPFVNLTASIAERIYREHIAGLDAVRSLPDMPAPNPVKYIDPDHGWD